MVSALVPGASGPGSNPGRGHCVVFLGKTLKTLTVPLSTQEYKWVPENCWGNLTNCGGVTCDGLASPPASQLLAASCYRNWYKLQRYGPVGSKASPTFDILFIGSVLNTKIAYTTAEKLTFEAFY